MKASSLRQTTGSRLLGKGGIAALVLGLLLALTTTGIAPQTASAGGYSAIDAKYQAVGGSRLLGAARGPEVRTSTGSHRDYARGAIYWSSRTGAHPNAGAIRAAYASKGWELGYLGYPTTDEYNYQGGRAQNFQNGYITWSSRGGTAVVVNGRVIPGAFCANSQVWMKGLASNGRWYTCGSKGRDANGHYHWNS